ncbi:MAG: adenosine kinase [Magnetococcus sp. DMHC-6]
MKTYHVYGIGHALLDMEFEVSDAFLQKMHLEKGRMTLVDLPQQEHLLKNTQTLLCKQTCGGSSANTVIGVAQFGGRAFHACKVAADEAGQFFASDMRANGVDNGLDKRMNTGTTGRCLVFITPDAERTMCTHLGISETFSIADIDESPLSMAEFLYIEGYLVTAESTLQAAIEATKIAKKHGVKTALTFSDPSMVTYFRSGLDQIIGDGLDLIFCNEHEAMQFAQTSTPEAAIPILLQKTRALVITLGARGALIHDGERLSSVAGLEVYAINTNGAGDLFAGAFLYGITHGYSFQNAARLAIKASALLVTQFGARLEPGQAMDICKTMEKTIP